VPHQSRHAAPSVLAVPKATRTLRFWGVPIVVSVGLMAALAALYLGGILNPSTNLQHFPIAVVNQDQGPTGAQIANQLVAGVDKNKFDMRLLSPDEASYQLDTAQVYGQVVIPMDFSQQLQALAAGATQPGSPPARPVITIAPNPRAGTLGASIASQTLTQAMNATNRQVGQEVSALPDGTGNGLSAFYYSLLLLLAGFTGSLVISTLVDSMLGYTPAEIGPVYRFADRVEMSRFRTLLIKWGLVLTLGLITSGIYLAIGNWLGMPIPSAWALFGYGVLAIVAVGVTATSMIAALGSMGLLVNLLVFVILGLPSAGATVPLQATPHFFVWLARFEPMHQVFLGTRTLLYFDGHPDAGLTRALEMCTLGLVIGLLLGAIVTMIYDRRGYHRIAMPTGETAKA
jgi:YhgE/Pip-like protein